MKVYISVDIEGCAGITHWDEAEKNHADWQEFREQMTREAVAAIEGAKIAGATEILVKDAHSSGRNIIASQLPADVRLIRRLQRDVRERGRTPDNIIEQYLATVRPSHEQFIEPSKRFADVIFPEGGMNEPAIDMLMARVRELTA